ncbi:Protein of unknown function (Ytp1) [Nakaseomyces glabratus]|nr:Protein of unknown function (Ytp1) [Nakaseomyces glabratus]KAH7584726.1 Protein of unknown function (Ytp1) [Nakaseomyces glabratus]KAI8383815.1 Protein of unknown function (Ytp1) [Nakaseomyces glabratus]KAI8394759.1 Protein of unknown function (Ytp1) [Nakaseomyces glabratus]QNG15790.1 uncharacterized protein GWK60_K09009 [Nakaseomyces glabratus]
MRFWWIVTLASLCAAHMHMDDDEDMSNEMGMGVSDTNLTPVPHEPKHLHGQPILDTHLTPAERLYWEKYDTTTFFTTDLGNRSAFKFHVATMFILLFLSYPVCLILNSVASSWYLAALTANLALTVASLISLLVFSTTFPEEWYANNFYHKTSWTVLILMLVHYIAAVGTLAAKRFGSGYVSLDIETVAYPLQDYDNYEVPDVVVNDGNTEDPSRLSPPTTVTPNDDTQESSLSHSHSEESLRFTDDSHKKPRKDKLLNKIPVNSKLQSIMDKFGVFFGIIFGFLNYPMLLILFVDACTGIAIGNLLGKGQRVFNLLAHWIKGGVFFVLGIVSLARYCGVGQKYGWAWNRLIIDRRSPYANSVWFKYSPIGGITMEGFESFLIFFYGSTNVFLEHLAGAGGAWTAKDLQHVSIAFMYFGTGLCGLLVEGFLNKWRFTHALVRTDYKEEEVLVANPGYSPNPFPTFTIFWTGILMSQHAQASETSTTIHVQWGSLLSYGSFFRLFTFLILYFSPEVNMEPFKPITELVSSFCLLAGGLIFMESTDQVVEGFEYRGFTPMFTFNISVGIVSLIMAWEMILLFWRRYLASN